METGLLKALPESATRDAETERYRTVVARNVQRNEKKEDPHLNVSYDSELNPTNGVSLSQLSPKVRDTLYESYGYVTIGVESGLVGVLAGIAQVVAPIEAQKIIWASENYSLLLQSSIEALQLGTDGGEITPELMARLFSLTIEGFNSAVWINQMKMGLAQVGLSPVDICVTNAQFNDFFAQFSGEVALFNGQFSSANPDITISQFYIPSSKQ